MAEPMSGTLANVAVMKPTPALSATTDVPELPPASRETPKPSPAAAPSADTPLPVAEPDAAAVVSPSPPEGTGESSGDQPPADDGEPAAPPARSRTPFAERLSEMARARNEAQERAHRAEIALAEERAKRAEEALAEARQRPAAPAPEIPRPRRSEYTDPDAYDDAIADWAEKRAEARAIAVTEAAQRQMRQERDEAERQRAESAVRSTAEAIEAQWIRRRDAYAAENPDYFDVAERDDVQITQAMAYAIKRSENGPKIAVYLGQHPEEALRISRLTDTPAQLVEMGILAAKVSAPPRVQPSRAPRPITPINSSAAGAAEKDPAEMTTNEYAEWRSKQDWARDHRIPILPTR